jgi:hypothetical protein
VIVSDAFIVYEGFADRAECANAILSLGATGLKRVGGAGRRVSAARSVPAFIDDARAYDGNVVLLVQRIVQRFESFATPRERAATRAIIFAGWRYDIGDRMALHCDGPRDLLYTAILYLSEGWQSDLRGNLMISPATTECHAADKHSDGSVCIVCGAQVIAPLVGRLVFISSKVGHFVETLRRGRRAFARYSLVVQFLRA